MASESVSDSAIPVEDVMMISHKDILGASAMESLELQFPLVFNLQLGLLMIEFTYN